MSEEHNNTPELNMEYLADVPVHISVVLGRTSMPLSDLLKLNKGAVIALNRSVGEPVDVHVNDRAVARGEIVIVDGNIGVTITELIADKSKS